MGFTSLRLEHSGSEHDNEILYYTKRGQFLDQVGTYKLLKKDSDA
jgi:hypothetical protein